MPVLTDVRAIGDNWKVTAGDVILTSFESFKLFAKTCRAEVMCLGKVLKARLGNPKHNFNVGHLHVRVRQNLLSTKDTILNL